MRLASTTKVLAKRASKYCRLSKCLSDIAAMASALPVSFFDRLPACSCLLLGTARETASQDFSSRLCRQHLAKLASYLSEQKVGADWGAVRITYPGSSHVLGWHVRLALMVRISKHVGLDVSGTWFALSMMTMPHQSALQSHIQCAGRCFQSGADGGRHIRHECAGVDNGNRPHQLRPGQVQGQSHGAEAGAPACPFPTASGDQAHVPAAQPPAALISLIHLHWHRAAASSGPGLCSFHPAGCQSQGEAPAVQHCVTDRIYLSFRFQFDCIFHAFIRDILMGYIRRRNTHFGSHWGAFQFSGCSQRLGPAQSIVSMFSLCIGVK